ncbi:HAMP domain-containing histidine kinase [Geomonas oryzisoli]|uniref:histidine kinase n=1 Tax=Geomonas oryzisoli TaxID=2847992 RepID=A0ABX8JAP9_9BACT|nr:HAMP domain-containing sensor histidine kinase [Geomonas oryzisoli]QWV94211.1 HAMP domain-containing histidine kinase [Geomonas oryzisoli]
MNWRPRLGTILLIINLGILLLPLGGISVLRLYESELVRRTETELISQGSLIGAAYREELLRIAAENAGTEKILNYGIPAKARPSRSDPSEKYHPINARLNLPDEKIHPPAQAAVPARTAIDPFALEAGSRVSSIMRSSTDSTLVGVRVVDIKGTVVATTGEERHLSLLNREEVRRALAGEYVSLLRERLDWDSSARRGNLVRVFVGMPIIHEGRVLGAVILSRTPLDIGKALYLVRGQLGIAAAVLLGLVIVITILTSVMVNRPLRALVSQAKEVQHGTKREMPVTGRFGIHEIAQLSDAISVMARTLEERADYIRTFAANVSHEFKTPLTSLRGTVELLHDHLQEMSEDERDRFLTIIARDAERMERLVRRLLDLARADTLTVGEERTDPAGALRAIADRYGEAGVKVVVRCEEDVVSVRMGHETFDSVVSNLIENARQHGGDGVQVEIRGLLGEHPEGCLFEMEVHDNGPGISDGNREKVFLPFFTTARKTGGSGLGLSIVQALLGAHGGSISLEQSEQGALFRVMVPAIPAQGGARS